MVIDVFSKYGWIKPLKDKKGETVENAFNEIFKANKRFLQMLWTDYGKEVYNTHVKDPLKGKTNKLYSAENKEKTSVVDAGIEQLKIKWENVFSE